MRWIFVICDGVICYELSLLSMLFSLYSELFVFIAFHMIVCMTINPSFLQSNKLILGIEWLLALAFNPEIIILFNSTLGT